MKLKYLTVLSAGVLTAALLAGCGGDQDAERHSQDLSPSGTLRVSDEPETSVTNDAMEGGGPVAPTTQTTTASRTPARTTATG